MQGCLKRGTSITHFISSRNDLYGGKLDRRADRALRAVLLRSISQRAETPRQPDELTVLGGWIWGDTAALAAKDPSSGTHRGLPRKNIQTDNLVNFRALIYDLTKARVKKATCFVVKGSRVELSNRGWASGEVMQALGVGRVQKKRESGRFQGNGSPNKESF